MENPELPISRSHNSRSDAASTIPQ